MEGSPVTDFVAAARAFCREVERSAFDTRTLMRLLLRLVDAALHLPHVDPADDIEAPEPLGLDDDVAAVRRIVAAVVGDADLYYTGHPGTGEAAVGSVVDDVEEVYRDVRRGLIAYDEGAPDDAVSQWRHTFERQWGAHATGAIAALHRATFGLPR